MRPYTYGTSWGVRTATFLPRKPIKKKFYFICEGENTEVNYFESFFQHRKELEVNPLLDFIIVKRTEDDKGKSAPICLLEHADKVLLDPLSLFDLKNDVFVFVFDLDVFRRRGKLKHYEEILSIFASKQYHYRLAITCPNFELFLLLHLEDSYNDIIAPRKDAIMEKKRTKKRILEKIVSAYMGINSKTNADIGNYVHSVRTAILQERNYLNQDISPQVATTQLTSTVGTCIQEILDCM